MLQQTFQALENTFETNNDACIDCAKAVVEVVCRILVDELDSVDGAAKPADESPDFGAWVSAAVKVLKLGNNSDNRFLKLVSQHHKLTTALGDLRNKQGPVSHGRDGFLDKLSVYHRRSAVLSADAIVTFLHQAYLEATVDFIRSREPYERFSHHHAKIDATSTLQAEVDESGILLLNITLADGQVLPLRVETSRLLYQLDRDAYLEALNAAQGVSPEVSALIPNDDALTISHD
jgi:Abortive infection C-terminus